MGSVGRALVGFLSGPPPPPTGPHLSPPTSNVLQPSSTFCPLFVSRRLGQCYLYARATGPQFKQHCPIRRTGRSAGNRVGVFHGVSSLFRVTRMIASNSTFRPHPGGGGGVVFSRNLFRLINAVFVIVRKHQSTAIIQGQLQPPRIWP